MLKAHGFGEVTLDMEWQGSSQSVIIIAQKGCVHDAALDCELENQVGGARAAKVSEGHANTRIQKELRAATTVIDTSAQ